MELAQLLWRLSVAGVTVLGPTVLFLLLWRGLMRMRDGELVRRVQARMEEQPATVGGGDGIPEGIPPLPVLPGTTRLVQCARCGERNAVAFEYCRECLAELPGE